MLNVINYSMIKGVWFDMEFIATTLIIIISIYMIYKLYKDYKNSETLDEKIIFWLIIFIFLFPLILYYLDRYNIPSVFK